LKAGCPRGVGVTAPWADPAGLRQSSRPAVLLAVILPGTSRRRANAVSASENHSFVDVVATAFLRRRLNNRRLRVAAKRGLRAVSAGAGDGLQMDFDHGASCFA